MIMTWAGRGWVKSKTCRITIVGGNKMLKAEAQNQMIAHGCGFLFSAEMSFLDRRKKQMIKYPIQH